MQAVAPPSALPVLEELQTNLLQAAEALAATSQGLQAAADAPGDGSADSAQAVNEHVAALAEAAARAKAVRGLRCLQVSWPSVVDGDAMGCVCWFAAVANKA